MAGNGSAVKVHIDHVVKKFQTRKGEMVALNGVDLDIHENEFITVVGPSGSGKSTLAKLLVHYYDVTGGAIRIGGQRLTDMSVESLNRQISYVSQEQFLFNISLLENIRLGKPEASDEEVMAAARKAQCGEFLSRLPEGIHTLAGDGGKQLSGGERQRISLARAILKDAPVIVLDEATASCIYTQKGNKKIRKPQAANQTALIFDRRAAARLLSINSIRRLCWS